MNKVAQVWIEHNPQTGTEKPFEVHVLVIASGKKHIASSCKTMKSAIKSVEKHWSAEHYEFIKQ